jgi:hypothetical protein
MTGIPANLPAILVAFAAAACVPLRAQLPPPPGSSPRVRVTPSTPGALPCEGQLLAQGDSGVFVGVDSAHTCRVELRDVRRIEVWEGRRSYAKLGATTFGLAGAVAGAILGLNSRPRCPKETGLFSFLSPCVGPFLASVGWVALTTIGGGGVGALVGDGLGSLVHGDRWRALPLNQLRVGVVPLPGDRLGLGASLAF